MTHTEQNTEHMSKKETLEQLCNKVADIKYELQQVLDALYKLEDEEESYVKHQSENDPNWLNP